MKGQIFVLLTALLLSILVTSTLLVTYQQKSFEEQKKVLRNVLKESVFLIENNLEDRKKLENNLINFFWFLRKKIWIRGKELKLIYLEVFGNKSNNFTFFFFNLLKDKLNVTLKLGKSLKNQVVNFNESWEGEFDEPLANYTLELITPIYNSNLTVIGVTSNHTYNFLLEVWYELAEKAYRAKITKNYFLS